MSLHSDSTIAIRPLEPDDAAAARAIFAAATGEPSPYAARLREWLHAALEATSGEHRSLVAVSGDDVVGIAIYGVVAGASGAAMLHVIAVAPAWVRHGAGALLLRAVEQWLRDGGARVAIAELPDDPSVDALRHLLLRFGFHEEARIADFYRTGVALVFLRHDLTPLGGDAQARID